MKPQAQNKQATAVSNDNTGSARTKRPAASTPSTTDFHQASVIPLGASSTIFKWGGGVKHKARDKKTSQQGISVRPTKSPTKLQKFKRKTD